MAFPTYTYTFTNGSTADATQVNQNFSDILNGISDTTKDMSVSALTAAGTSTLNGNVTLGNASSKTITFNGVMSSTLLIGANNSYDLGGVTTQGLRALYFSSAAAAHTTKLLGQTTSADINITLPPITGTLAVYTDPTVTIKSSGSGTYTVPANCKWLRIRMVGAGGGGAGSGTTNGTVNAAATDTTFSVHSGAAILTAGHGLVGNRGSTTLGGAGGTNSTAAGATIIISMTGNDGAGGYTENLATDISFSGSAGGAGPWGGAGQAGVTTGGNSVANSGAGGPSGGMSAVANGIVGGGGGAGGYIEAIITSPSASYDYSIGTAGVGQSGGTSGAAGGNGGSGVIYIEEYYG